MTNLVLRALSLVAASPILEMIKAWLIKQMLRVSAIGLLPWVLLKSAPGKVYDYLGNSYLDFLNYVSFYIPVPEFLFHTRPETIIKISVWILLLYAVGMIVLSLIRRFISVINRIKSLIDGKNSRR